MTLMLDTEGEPIPLADDGGTLFNTLLHDWHDGNGPILSINIPGFFETERGVYGSAGVLIASLKDVLEEYLEDAGWGDGATSVPAFASWLRAYADRLDEMAAEVVSPRSEEAPAAASSQPHGAMPQLEGEHTTALGDRHGG